MASAIFCLTISRFQKYPVVALILIRSVIFFFCRGKGDDLKFTKSLTESWIVDQSRIRFVSKASLQNEAVINVFHWPKNLYLLTERSWLLTPKAYSTFWARFGLVGVRTSSSSSPYPELTFAKSDNYISFHRDNQKNVCIARIYCYMYQGREMFLKHLQNARNLDFHVGSRSMTSFQVGSILRVMKNTYNILPQSLR